MIYFFIGEDRLGKDQKIDEIKKDIFNSSDALKFDYEILHATKLDPAELKKSLYALPAIALKRLILIRTAEKLSAQNKELILAFAALKEKRVVVILDSDAADAADSFARQITPYAKITSFSKGSKLNVFDMTKAMSMRQSTQALKILSNLFEEGNHPLQIMGGLVWFWGKSRPQLSRDKFQEGLLALEEADLNIKRSRLNPEHALEVLVVKLSAI